MSSPEWPNDVEIRLHERFIDFGDLTADVIAYVARRCDEGLGWGKPSDDAVPTTEGRLWRELAAELAEAGASTVRELDVERQIGAAKRLGIPRRGWALLERRSD